MKTIEIALRPEEAAGDATVKKYLQQHLSLSAGANLQFKIIKRSVDARSREVKMRLRIVYSINEPLNVQSFEKRKLQNVSLSKPVVIIGCGPAGLFAALHLIELGIKPVIIERGKNVKDRRRDLAAINKQRIINPDSNYCFGEGGAGTYSDGKLYTRSNKRGNVEKMLHTFIEFGADENIAVDAHPHIGTNKLPKIIEAMRQAILECRGEILFNTRFENLILNNNVIKGVEVKSIEGGSQYKIETSAVILATGHSARDVFENFHRNKIAIEAKPFALGVRIEHPQHIIDTIQYHCDVRNEYLPPASYSVVHQSEGRGVYSFCMCPGGIIAPAATAPGEIVVNGWSPSKRNNPFANSGMVVSVNENDFKKFENKNQLAALEYQRQVEQNCFQAGGSNLSAPAQRMIDFIENRNSISLPTCSYIPGIVPSQLNEVLPDEISFALRDALKNFGKKMKSYYTNEAVLVATESRTSSPVRIPRDNETLMHTQIKGLFPCGEGAGYAGGIISAAIDGERCAEAAKNLLY